MTVAQQAGKIRVLPQDVVSRIAAGEVVERPASVVKELIENSLDAGCTRIMIDINRAGLGLIRVVDDGEGMSRGDAVLALERHATSKLRSDQDLSSIRTRGFRGEALPSIASVSRIKLVTADRSAAVGTQMILSGGSVESVEDSASPVGTRIEVADLFYNTPARRKFLKSAATEFSHITQVVQQASLSAPSTQFRLTHNDQNVLEYPAVSSRDDRVRQVYHQRFLQLAVAVRAAAPGYTLEGYVISPDQAKAGRTPQDVFVNLRPVRNPTITHAVHEGYGSFLAKGQHPLFVVFLEVDPARVDVNVHPGKREVRFLEQDVVHQLIRRAVREALGGSSAEEPRSSPGSPRGAFGESAAPSYWVQSPDRGEHSPAYQAGEQAGLQLPVGSLAEPGSDRAGERGLPYAVEQGVTPLGQIARTFLVAQVGTELQVVDQHTAHERVLFERLLRAWASRRIESQPLLIPEPVDLPAHHRLILEQHLADLEKLGLSIEPFGGASYVVRAVPAILGPLDYGGFVEDLIDDLSQWNSLSSLEAKLRPIWATLACHSAVRAGREMGLPEVKQLIEDWVHEGLPMTCPHGRRVALRLSTDELSRIFGRA